MYLLTLALLSAAVGYLLATGRFGRRMDETTGRVRTTTARWISNIGDQWKGLFNRQAQADAFRAWALGSGASLLPDDFKKWLAGLTAGEAQDFSRALGEYADSLGFSLASLVEGGLDHDPRMRQVFVEAIVVYSPAYRKVRKAQEQAQVEAEKTAAREADVKAAEKAPSRRKDHNGAKESSEVAAAD